MFKTLKLLSLFLCVFTASLSCTVSLDLVTDGYVEIDTPLINPDRGFYHQIGGGHAKLHPEEVKAPNVNHTVYRVYFSLRGFEEKEIDTKTLENLEALLKKAQKVGVTLIPRFYYTWGYEKGKPFSSPDENTIIGHVKQVAKILNKYPDAISFLEAGFIGAWGEWHTDQYGNQKEFLPFRKTLLQTLISELDQKILIALRYTPDHRKMGNLQGIERVGLHHDCPNYGNDTYPESNAQTITIDRPQGGEVCELDPRGQFGESTDHEKYYGCKTMIQYFNKFNFDVLNGSDWSGSHSRFRRQGCYTEIKNKLGYRFVLRGSKFENGILYFEVENVGFGKSFKSRKLSLKIGDKVVPTSIDIKNWHSGGKFIEKIEIGNTNEKSAEILIDGKIKFANSKGNRVFLHK